MGLPSNVTYCTVTGTFVQAVADGSDSDHNPDASPVSGASITFTPSVNLLRDPTAPGTVIVPKAITVTTDASGQIIDAQGNPGVVLVATDDPNVTPINWTWNVSTLIGSTPISFDIAAPGGTTVDLAQVIPVPAAPGVVLQPGVPGPANSLTIGTVTSGSPAAASISGTSPNQVLSLVLPAGTNGNNGSPGSLNYVWNGTEYLDASGNQPSSTIPAGVALRIFDWGDYTGAPTTVPTVSGVRDLYVQARDYATAMLLGGGAGSSTASFPGIVDVDTFDGTTDAGKLSNAISYAMAQTHIPWLQLPARVFDTGTSTFAVGTGLKILGAGFPLGPQNLEVSSGVGVAGVWKTSCGSGASALLQATATVYDWKLVGIAFQGTSSSQIARSTVNAYACQFDNLTFYDCKNAFGTPTEKFLTTQGLWSGHHTCEGFADTQFTIGGSDALFTWYLNADSPSSPAAGGKPIVIFSFLSKTKHHGYMYLTAEGDWEGLQILGSDTCRMDFFGGTFEGRSQTSLATRSVLDMQGGHAVFWGAQFDQVSDTASAVGVISQTGGTLELLSPEYDRGSGVAATFPLLYQTGGVARVDRPKASVTGEQIRLRWSTGVTDTVPLLTNGYTV